MGIRWDCGNSANCSTNCFTFGSVDSDPPVHGNIGDGDTGQYFMCLILKITVIHHISSSAVLSPSFPWIFLPLNIWYLKMHRTHRLQLSGFCSFVVFTDKHNCNVIHLHDTRVQYSQQKCLQNQTQCIFYYSKVFFKNDWWLQWIKCLGNCVIKWRPKKG